jgi:hypothetical protein
MRFLHYQNPSQTALMNSARTAAGFLVMVSFCLRVGAAAQIGFDESGVMLVDGKKTFVISFALPPPPGGKTPDQAVLTQS